MDSATGTKRSWEGIPLRNDAAQSKSPTEAMAESTTNILSMFEGFRDELDQHHDRRERLIKISRDITALSKKMCASNFIYTPPQLPYQTNKNRTNSIFSLQRFAHPTNTVVRKQNTN